MAKRISEETKFIKLIQESTIDLNFTFENKRGEKTTLLLEACGYNEWKIAEALLKKGADPAIETEGRTSLWIACRWGDKKIVKILLAHNKDEKDNAYKINFDKKDNEKKTALDIAKEALSIEEKKSSIITKEDTLKSQNFSKEKDQQDIKDRLEIIVLLTQAMHKKNSHRS